MNMQIKMITVSYTTLNNISTAVVHSSTRSRDNGQCQVTSEGVPDLCVPMWLRVWTVVYYASVVSPFDAESTVVWSNVVTQCDSTLQLNVLVTIKNI